MPWRADLLGPEIQKAEYRTFMSRAELLDLILSTLLVAVGAAIEAVALQLFLVPSNIAPGGIAGLAIIINHLTGWPIGWMVLIGNIPIQAAAWRMLGGGRVVFQTIVFIVIFSAGTEVLAPLLPTQGLTDQGLLNAIFGGVLAGIGGGLVLRGGGTTGGTSTLARILNDRYGLPLTSAYFFTDALVILLAGLVFGWEPALLAIVLMYVYGAVNDYVLEGPSVIRTLTIITDQPEAVAERLLHELGRGVTAWQGKGMYTGQERTILFVTVARSQVSASRRLIHAADPRAFVVIEQGHVAFGEGFRKAERN